MAINISQAFHRTSANPVDETMALTKAQMLTVNDNLMPAYYLTICQDDGAIYLYDKSATASAETGKFSIFEGGKTIQVEEIPTAATEYVGIILQYIGETDTNYINGYFYKCVEDSSTTPSTYSWKNVEVQNGTISMELTQSDYDNLTEEQKTDGTVYYITDAEVFTTANAPCGFTPIGTVISVMGNNAPRNYLACNGQTVNIIDYPELADYFEQQFGSKNKFGGDGTTTFGLPDLRGEFLRGTGTNSHNTQGSGAAVGIHQDSTEFPNIGLNKNTSGTVGIYVLDIPTTNNTSDGPYFTDSTYNRFNSGKNAWTTIGSEYSSTITNGIVRVRPTNTSVLYCIAVRDIYVDARYDYSTDEKVVGTWIDGKPLYQKTFTNTFGTITDGTVSTVQIADLGSDVIPKQIDAFCNGSPQGSWGSSNQYFLRACFQGSVLTAECNRNPFSNKLIMITVRYTKTTD